MIGLAFLTKDRQALLAFFDFPPSIGGPSAYIKP
jgi:hypothetical protein